MALLCSSTEVEVDAAKKKGTQTVCRNDTYYRLDFFRVLNTNINFLFFSNSLLTFMSALRKFNPNTQSRGPGPCPGGF